jgi:hypothetical protein
MTEARKPKNTLAAQHARARLARAVKVLRSLDKQRQALRDIACSGARADAAWFEGAPVADVGMVLSAAVTRWGEGGRKCRRWTPKDAVDLEDMLDVMTERQARHYKGPSSCGSVVTAARLKAGYMPDHSD